MKSAHFNTVINTPEFKAIEEKAIGFFIQSEIDQFEKHPSKFAIESFKIHFIIKLARVFDSYILDTDKLNSYELSIGTELRLDISLGLERDGQKFGLRTHTIMAGGYIQCLHLRYIVDTNLRKQSDKSLEKELKAKITRLNKTQQLENDIEIFKARIESCKEFISVQGARSEESVIADIRNEFESVDVYGRILNTSFAQYQINTADRTNKDDLFQTEAEYENNKIQMWEEHKTRHLGYHYANINSCKSQIKEFTKKIEKTEAKLQTLGA